MFQSKNARLCHDSFLISPPVFFSLCIYFLYFPLSLLHRYFLVVFFFMPSFFQLLFSFPLFLSCLPHLVFISAEAAPADNTDIIIQPRVACLFTVVFLCSAAGCTLRGSLMTVVGQVYKKTLTALLMTSWLYAGFQLTNTNEVVPMNGGITSR